ncbi:hypothetical protein ABB37_01341 [Leptomonas pyrrhocoris]|uniref:Uncharacterized protein n=1 Tax=Leptomonas pyrrhocoris TaxID=157538 RepID=A0A0M9G8K6_LEPPY|nr:hypothetical protein ABB37_01341 [Leptomonas pyrrhocoris]XP_015663323.1 hypothetical protein ABB37_01341 [Leptomonas pyrrhocoris]KPA84883.1 hypothetical protein ABB37_01341 [Leptomonas pyrrhocoris]KPA84884.1 hypothetical protein ABB37_01341 [Leptomonas pyrrhocoris]|eukprot:XP_015663322.1 hypothetical protein ABB37_01341 [Leptomonas pyrrhocoris]
MSRLDKQQHQEHVVGTVHDTSVRLFAFSNTRPRYHVVFSPEEPLIILKSRKSATPQHPCQQWEPLCSLIFKAQPNTTHAVYVADTTEMSSVLTNEQEEHVNGAAVGPLLKRLSNTLTRLNPHNATMVAAGVSAHLGLKYVLVGEKTLGHRDRLVQRIILVCPTPLNALVALTNAVAKKPVADGYPLPEVIVLLKDPAEVPEWTEWLQCLRDTLQRIASYRVVTDLSPTLFSAVAREAGLDRADGTTVDVQQRHPDPRVYRIDFVLSKQTKTVIQLPRLSPLSTLGYDEDEEEEDGHDHGHHHHHHHGHGHHHGDVVDAHGAESEEDGDVETEGDFEDDDSASADGVEDAEEGNTEGRAHAHHHDCDGHHHHHSNHHGCGSLCGPDSDHAGAEDEDGEEAGGSMLVSGLQAVAHWCDPVRVIVEGRVLDLNGGLVGTTDGCVVVSNLKEMADADTTLSAFLTRAATSTVAKWTAPKPPAVAIAALLHRDEEGRTTLVAEEVRPLTKAEVRQSMTAGSSLEEIPVQYNTSRIAHSYGALLIRGRKCALVRDVDEARRLGHNTHLRIPSAPHNSAEESAMECAVRALCDGCEVSSDNFYLPSYLPPVVYYTAASTAGAKRCATVYTALAISPPPRGPESDAVEDAPEPEEPYDWVSFSRALTLLATEEEREALREAQRHLEKAHKAGFYASLKGCGVFGEEVKPLAGDASTAAPAAAASSASSSQNGKGKTVPARAKSLAGIEFYVVACPGDAAQELVPVVLRALQTHSVLVCGASITTTAIEEIAMEAKQQGEQHVLLYLGEEEDAQAFCEEHLLELTEEKHATAQVFTVLLPQVAVSSLSLAAAGTTATSASAEARLDALLAAARVSDALITLVPPERMSAEEKATLRVCCRANAELSLVYSWEARRPFKLESEDDDDLSKGDDDAAALREFTVRLPAGVPVAPAALAYLTRAGSLDCFFAEGRCRLLFAQGDVWIPTRGATQGFVYLDITSHCLAVEPGDEWDGASDAARTSELTLLIWCANAAAAAEVAAQVSVVEGQLRWSEERDGASWAAAHDPLPKWE